MSPDVAITVLYKALKQSQRYWGLSFIARSKVASKALSAEIRAAFHLDLT